MAADFPKYLEDFRCPRSGSRLTIDNDQLNPEQNTESDITYPFLDGIPNFLRYGSVAEEGSIQRLSELIDVTREKGWRKAIEKIFGAGSGIQKYNDTPERFSFLDFLSVGEFSDVLEVGTGLGGITLELARRSGRLFCLDVISEQIVFTRLRCQEEGIDNVKFACGGDDNLLPFADRTMDFVVLNLVFEWCSSRNIDKPGSLGQKLMLKEVNRVLRPGGTVYLSTKNRYALRLFTGQKDEHAYEMRFGHVLPLWLMRFILRVRGYDQPGGGLYSYRALQRMLTHAGFSDLSSYWAAPEMRYPEHFIPTTTRAIRAARRMPNFRQGEIRRTQLMMSLIPARLVKYFTPSLTFVARKPAVGADIVKL